MKVKLLLLVAIAALPLLLLSGFELDQQTAEHRRSTGQEILRTSSLLAEHVEDLTLRSHAVLELLADHPTIRNGTAKSGTSYWPRCQDATPSSTSYFS